MSYTIMDVREIPELSRKDVHDGRRCGGDCRGLSDARLSDKVVGTAAYTAFRNWGWQGAVQCGCPRRAERLAFVCLRFAGVDGEGNGRARRVAADVLPAREGEVKL